MRTSQRGQVIVLFVGIVIPLIILVGLAIDGSYAYVQRRSAQNASDLASLAGANQIAVALGTANGGAITMHDCDVRKAIDRVLAANGSQPIPQLTYGTAAGPQYISGAGSIVRPVSYDASCSSLIPTASGAMGVQIGATRQWQPFFLGIIGISKWTASAVSDARTGYLAAPPAGSVFPMGIAQSSFDQTVSGHFVLCPPGSTPVSQGGTCPDQTLDGSKESSGANAPGNFGWLKFGQANNCAGFGLGMTNDGCPNGAASGFLQSEIDGTYTGNCCSAPTGGAAPDDRIGGLQGHNGKGGDNCSAIVASKATYLVPIWDTDGGNGNSMWYHIVGFAGFQITACDGGKNATGVWRTAIFPGPTSQTVPPGLVKIMSVQLIK